MFQRVSTDGTRVDCSYLCDSYSGTEPTAVWIVGGGPSLNSEAAAHIKRSGAPVCCINLGGRASDGEAPLIQPDIFVAWDEVARFPRSVFLNPRITKFLLYGRRADFIAGGTEKACDCPATYFVDTERRGYHNWLQPGAEKTNHSRDSFVMAIDVLFRLGFRRIFCAGTDMIIRPTPEQIQYARSSSSEKTPLEYEDGLARHYLNPGKSDRHVGSDRLKEFVDACVRAGVAASPDAVCEALQKVTEREHQYRCGERKPFKAAVHTDQHYWQVVQMLRQARRNMTLNGLQLVSCTPESRLNDYFNFVPIKDAADSILQQVGDPVNEKTIGRLTGNLDRVELPFNQDVTPVEWDRQLEARRNNGCGCGGKKQAADPQDEKRKAVEARLKGIREHKAVQVAEEG